VVFLDPTQTAWAACTREASESGRGEAMLYGDYFLIHFSHEHMQDEDVRNFIRSDVRNKIMGTWSSLGELFDPSSRIGATPVAKCPAHGLSNVLTARRSEATAWSASAFFSRQPCDHLSAIRCTNLTNHANSKFDSSPSPFGCPPEDEKRDYPAGRSENARRMRQEREGRKITKLDGRQATSEHRFEARIFQVLLTHTSQHATINADVGAKNGRPMAQATVALEASDLGEK